MSDRNEERQVPSPSPDPQLDALLRESLRREEPPPGFADRVLARVDGQRRRSRTAAVYRWMAAAACIVLAYGGWQAYEDQIRERRQREAAEQALLAMRITGEKLHRVRQITARHLPIQLGQTSH